MSNGNDKLRERVEKRLAEERELAQCTIRVEVENRTVTLRGSIADPRLRAVAENAARFAAQGAPVKSLLAPASDFARLT